VRDPLADAKFNTALANRMLAHEGVLDAFGHVSMRHPNDPGRYLLSRSRSPQLVEPGDLIEFTLDSAPAAPVEAQLYSERVIHGEIYKARPDVMAVCHHHSPAIMPYVIAGVDIVPVFHLGAVMGEVAPFWDSRDEFGDTNLLVAKPEEGASLARALGPHSAVLMRRHGATVVGRDVRELVARSIYMCVNADYQMRAQLLGGLGPLTRGEVKLAGALFVQPNVTSRTWEYWTMRLAQAGRLPPGAARAKMTKGKSGQGSRRRSRR
jgi:ribulose-5-phosphate 4-epimerase/fuculose-1-phosphate aldolase